MLAKEFSPVPLENQPVVRRFLPALQVEGGGTVVAAEEVSPLPAAVAGVVVGGSAAPPDVSHQLPAPLLHVFGLRRR